MLNNEIKRRIDAARNVLVGQIPDPKGQVEQITTALMYKFMGDLDRKAEKNGGQRSFFIGKYARFAWDKLMATTLGGDERRELYAEAVEQMAANERLPEGFRSMFKGAYLPIRDGRILTLFLKEIDALPYRHSEDLGTPFEYLLSIMGTQGDAGQFRTPRHIIDFIVAVIDPQKGERIHDPACGTAGFLISAFRHIQAANTRNSPGDLLMPKEKRTLTQNLIGKELDPGMVRLSLVNMYLHGIRQPQVSEYDTLTYDELWDESYDAILANPPFMTPKGGIHPHDRFAVRAKRSEVLFVDYIAEHLSPRGRAGIIVPEGIIFQSQNAYKELRRLLVEDWGLWAVASLPAGVFNPYSGVKTSILFLDKSRGRSADELLFVQVRADGFDLGAQRRSIVENDLPQARQILDAWKQGRKLENGEMALWVAKDKIAEDGEYNLSAERYRTEVDYSYAKWQMVKLGDVCEFNPRFSDSLTDNAEVPFVPMAAVGAGDGTIDLSRNRPYAEVRKGYTPFSTGDVIFAKITPCMENGKVAIVPQIKNRVAFGSTEFHVLRSYDVLDSRYLYYIISRENFRKNAADNMTGTAGQKRVPVSFLQNSKIPLPPLSMQEEIVAEVEGYQRVIDGAHLAITNWKPTIAVDPDWQMVKLGDVAEMKTGFACGKSNKNGNGVLHLRPMNIKTSGRLTLEDSKYITEEDARIKAEHFVKEGDVLFNNTNSKELVGKTCVVNKKIRAVYSNHITRIRTDENEYKSNLLALMLNGLWSDGLFLRLCNKWVGQAGINLTELSKIKISLPPLEVQQQIVAKISEEEDAIGACRKLIESHEEKIRTKISALWGGKE